MNGAWRRVEQAGLDRAGRTRLRRGQRQQPQQPRVLRTQPIYLPAQIDDLRVEGSQTQAAVAVIVHPRHHAILSLSHPLAWI